MSENSFHASMNEFKEEEPNESPTSSMETLWTRQWEKENPEPDRKDFEKDWAYACARILWLNKRYADWQKRHEQSKE